MTKKICFSEETVSLLFGYLSELPYKFNPGIVIERLKSDGVPAELKEEQNTVVDDQAAS